MLVAQPEREYMLYFAQIVAPSGPGTSQLQIILPLLVGVISPLLVAVITRWNASSALKAVVNLLLTAVGGYLTQLPNGVSLREGVFAVLISWLTAVLAYQQVYSKTGVTAKIAVKTRNVGIGGSSLDEPGF